MKDKRRDSVETLKWSCKILSDFAIIKPTHWRLTTWLTSTTMFWPQKRNEPRTFPRKKASRRCLQTVQNNGELQRTAGPERPSTRHHLSANVTQLWRETAKASIPVNSLPSQVLVTTALSLRKVPAELSSIYLLKWLDRKLSTRFLHPFPKREFARILTERMKMQKNRWV